MRRDPDSTKIEAIRVPTSLYRHVGMIQFVGVSFAGSIQKPEIMVVKIEHAATKLGGELGSTGTMFWISEFVDSA
jgi:hypothetical protein